MMGIRYHFKKFSVADLGLIISKLCLNPRTTNCDKNFPDKVISRVIRSEKINDTSKKIESSMDPYTFPLAKSSDTIPTECYDNLPHRISEGIWALIRRS